MAGRLLCWAVRPFQNSMKKKTETPEPETKQAPAPLDRMVRVVNVDTRVITEAGKTYQPGEQFDLTPERADAYKQRVRRVR